jgi:hypothetical protein
MAEVIEQLDAAATDLRTVKELEGRAQTMQRGQEEALREIADEKKIAKDFAKAKVQEANIKADKIVSEARKTADAVLNSAQTKASAVDNELKQKEQESLDKLAKANEDLAFAKEELAKVDALAAAAEKKLIDAQAKIQKMLEV